MYTLGIETSCDETAAAVLRDEIVLANVVSSQIAIHRKYGGVVPELASREHLRNILPVVRAALEEAQVPLSAIGLVAATYAPGLVGALLVGLSFAKALAYGLGVPLVGVHHAEGHLLAAHLENPAPAYPFVALLVSGGHTALYHVRGLGDYRLLGRTRDDAAGEAFDKAAKLLGLEYPGGPAIARSAQEGNPEAVRFPRALLTGYDFSFSGLKTALRNHVALFTRKDRGIDPAFSVPDAAASFQEAVVDILARKTLQAADEINADRIVLAGGVAANVLLRERLAAETNRRGIALFLPSPSLCVDNAAMIGLAGYLRFQRGEAAGLGLNARASMPL